MKYPPLCLDQLRTLSQENNTSFYLTQLTADWLADGAHTRDGVEGFLCNNQHLSKAAAEEFVTLVLAVFDNAAQEREWLDVDTVRKAKALYPDTFRSVVRSGWTHGDYRHYGLEYLASELHEVRVRGLKWLAEYPF